MGLRKKDAVAGLFDALFFLAVASVVSVSLLSMLGGDPTISGKEADRVEAAHTVLLRTTIAGPANNTYSVEELMRGWVRDDENSFNITSILDLLLPGMGWSWTVSRGVESYHLGSTVDPGSSVYCSLIRAWVGSEELTFRLEAWMA